ncbi:MAG: HEAT repeat domain-containing protein, partial [Bacteroidia bacterium]|nr:HEAT repeat domain-containing protein [Bacteroidia bacterium]
MVKAILPELLQDPNTEVKVAAIKTASRLQVEGVENTLLNFVKSDGSEKVRATALDALFNLKSQRLDEALETALADRSKEVRSAALEILPKSSLQEAVAVNLL